MENHDYEEEEERSRIMRVWKKGQFAVDGNGTPLRCIAADDELAVFAPVYTRRRHEEMMPNKDVTMVTDYTNLCAYENREGVNPSSDLHPISESRLYKE